MKRWVLLLGVLGAVGCTHELLREPTEQVTLTGGLEVHWRTLGRESAAGKPQPLVLSLRSVGAGPVVLCRVLRLDGGGGSASAHFVRRPAPGSFRYLPESDSVATVGEGGSPFSLAPAFFWYEHVLYPGGEGVGVDLGQVSPGAVVRLVVEYLPLSYGRLSLAGYAESASAAPEPQGAAAAGSATASVRFRRLSEELLRQKQPRALFLRNEYLPPITRVPLEIPWGAREPRPSGKGVTPPGG